MHTYYFILRDDRERVASLSASEMQALVQRYMKWRNDNSSHVTGGQKLTDGQGRVLRFLAGSLNVSDGPYIEAKEVLGGFFIIAAANYDAAQAIAATCPHLEFGSIELREVEPTA